MPDPPERNLALERIIDRLELGTLSCAYEGCDHEAPKPDLDAHAGECKYRLRPKKSNKAENAENDEQARPSLSGLTTFLLTASSITLVVAGTMFVGDSKAPLFLGVIGSCLTLASFTKFLSFPGFNDNVEFDTSDLVLKLASFLAINSSIITFAVSPTNQAHIMGEYRMFTKMKVIETFITSKLIKML